MTKGNRRSISHSSDTRLGAILDEAERRKEEEWKAKGRKTSLFIGIPVAALIVWAAIFLIQYQANNPPVQSKPVAAAPPVAPPTAEDQKDMAQFDSFRPNSQRVVKQSAPAAAPSGQIVDKGDIDFAMRLLNFGQAADKAAPKKP